MVEIKNIFLYSCAGANLLRLLALELRHDAYEKRLRLHAKSKNSHDLLLPTSISQYDTNVLRAQVDTLLLEQPKFTTALSFLVDLCARPLCILFIKY